MGAMLADGGFRPSALGLANAGGRVRPADPGSSRNHHLARPFRRYRSPRSAVAGYPRRAPAYFGWRRVPGHKITGPMLLAVNANNTNTVFAVWDGARLTGAWRAATDARRTADEYVVWLDHLLALKDLSRREIDGTIIASVVPEANFNLRRLCREYCRSEPLVVGEPGVKIGARSLVDRPEEVGA